MTIKPITIEISPRSIFTIFFLIVGLYLTIQLLPIIGLLFVTVILASALHSLVKQLCRYRIPKTAAILIIYAFIFILFILITFIIFPPLILQTTFYFR